MARDCEKCITSATYTQNTLIPRYIAQKEREYAIRKYGIDPASKCQYAGEEKMLIKTCCGKKTREVETLYCNLFEETVEKANCSHCARTKDFHISIGGKTNRFGHGIGDTIAGLWAIEGFKAQFPQYDVTYYTPHGNWAKLAYREVKPLAEMPKEHPNAYYFNEDYNRQVESEQNRIEWYCSKLECSPKRPELRFPKRRILKEDSYVLLAPFSAWHTRQWPLSHWLYLDKLLTESGRKVVVMGVAKDANDMKRFSKKTNYYYGMPPEIVCNLVYFSELVIANDSMATHLAGTMGHPCVALHAQLSASALWKYYGSVRSVTPRSECSPCFFKAERGYCCNSGCWALSSITPTEVFTIAIELMEKNYVRERK